MPHLGHTIASFMAPFAAPLSCHRQKHKIPIFMKERLIIITLIDIRRSRDMMISDIDYF